MLFIHSGTWRAGVAKDMRPGGKCSVNAGAHLAVLDFNNVIELGGDLVTMADQLAVASAAWVSKNARIFGRDPSGLVCRRVLGSGGHWVGVLLHHTN